MKKIIAVGFYDDFARFFLTIKKELKKKEKLSFHYYSIYASGFIYSLIRLNRSSLISFSMWLKLLLNKKKYSKLCHVKKYKGVNIDDVIFYHVKLDSKKSLLYRLIALAYIDLIDDFFKKNRIDIIILSGDTRVSIEVFSKLAKKYNVKTYYFEQGPFNTTIFDDVGVNAKSSFKNKNNYISKISIEEKETVLKNFLSNKRKKYIRNKLYRLIDYILQYLLNRINLFPRDLLIQRKNKKTSFPFHQPNNNNSNYFLLILQVPFDANMIHYSPHFNNHHEIVKYSYENLPSGYELVVREHPLHKGRYEKEMYEYIISNRILMDKFNDLYKSIEYSKVVVVNNSTVGIEAISKYKNVIVLGDCYYDQDDVCFKLKNKNEGNKLFENALKNIIERRKITDFLYELTQKYLIKGHFRDHNLISTKVISKIILEKYDKA